MNGILGYETSLSPEMENLFQAWKSKYASKDSGSDYDLRGAFLAGLTPNSETGHWPDTFKKPNEPTFSIESQYAPMRPDLAGMWSGNSYIPQGPMAQNSPSLISKILGKFR